MASEAVGGLRGRDLKNFENKTAAWEIHLGLGFRSLGQVITKLQPFEMAHFNLKQTVVSTLMLQSFNTLYNKIVLNPLFSASC